MNRSWYSRIGGVALVLCLAASIVSSGCLRGQPFPEPTARQKEVAMNLWCSESYSRMKQYMMEGTFEDQMNGQKMWDRARADAKVISEKLAKRLDVSQEQALLILNAAVDEKGGGAGAYGVCSSR